MEEENVDLFREMLIDSSLSLEALSDECSRPTEEMMSVDIFEDMPQKTAISHNQACSDERSFDILSREADHLPKAEDTGEDYAKLLSNAVAGNDIKEAKQIFEAWMENKKETKTKATRRRVKCPVPQCGKVIQDLNRHLQTVHRWHEIDAKAARGKYGLRKLKELKTGRKRKNYTRKVCPIMACQHAVVRLGNHLRQSHHIKDQRLINTLKSEAKRPSYEEIRSKGESREKEVAELSYTTKEIEQIEEIEEIEAEDMEQPNVDLTSSEKHVMAAFIEWLQSMDGSNKKEKDAKAQARHIIFIKRTIEDASAHGSHEKLDDITIVLDTKAVCGLWLDEFMKKRKPGTVKTYLHSLLSFVKFLTCVDSLVDVEDKVLTTMQMKVQHWLKSLRRPLNERKWEKKEEDARKLAKPEDFIKFDEATCIQEAVRVLDRFLTSKSAISMSEYTLVRNFLISTVLVDNASRSGAVANVSVQDIQNATRDGNMMVVTVLDHKTLVATGPANLCLPLETFKQLDLFISKIRPKIVCAKTPGADEVFLTWHGQPMSSSAISSAFNSCWKNATGKTMNASLMRKSQVTHIHSYQPQLKQDLALHMNHAVRTAENVYFAQEKKTRSAATATAMRTIMRSKKGNRQLTDEDLRTLFSKNLARGQIKLLEVQEAADTDDRIKGNERKIYDRLRYCIRKDIDKSPSVNAKEIQEEDFSDELFDSNLEKESSSDSEEEATVPAIKHTFTKEETYIIKIVFKEEIEKNAQINKEKVRKIMMKSSPLKAMFQEGDIRQLVVKIWNLRRAFRKGKKK